MDRATGKTQDAFVEFFSVPDAKAWAQVVQSRSNSINKLGDRILDVQLSSQAELMGEIFPRAKSINWSGGTSGKEVVAEAPRDIFDTGFKGFVTLEELQALVRHAEQPHRVSDSSYSTGSYHHYHLPLQDVHLLDPRANIDLHAVYLYSEMPSSALHNTHLPPFEISLASYHTLHSCHTQCSLQCDHRNHTIASLATASNLFSQSRFGSWSDRYQDSPRQCRTPV